MMVIHIKTENAQPDPSLHKHEPGTSSVHTAGFPSHQFSWGLGHNCFHCPFTEPQSLWRTTALQLMCGICLPEAAEMSHLQVIRVSRDSSLMKGIHKQINGHWGAEWQWWRQSEPILFWYTQTFRIDTATEKHSFWRFILIWNHMCYETTNANIKAYLYINKWAYWTQ